MMSPGRAAERMTGVDVAERCPSTKCRTLNDHPYELLGDLQGVGLSRAGGRSPAPAFANDARASVGYEAVGVLVLDADLHEVAATERSPMSIRTASAGSAASSTAFRS